MAILFGQKIGRKMSAGHTFLREEFPAGAALTPLLLDSLLLKN